MMKRLCILLFGLLAMTATQGQAVGKLEIHHLSGDFYVYTTYNLFAGKPFPSNSMYLVTPEGVLLIDTPWDSTQCQPLLDSIARRHAQPVRMCISTHSHDDRTGGLDYFRSKGIATYSSWHTLELCRKNGEQEAEYSFAQDTVFQLGGHRFEVFYPGEGHTADNIVLWFPEGRVLYGGCLVKSAESEGLGYIGDANLRAWPASIRALQKRYPKAKWVIPGHFRWGGRESLRWTLRLLEEKEKAD